MIFSQTSKTKLPASASLMMGASFQYGLTPFETVRIYMSSCSEYKFSVFAHLQHINRLFRTMEALDIDIAYSKKEISKRFLEIVGNLSCDTDYIIKIMVYTTDASWSGASNFEIAYLVKESPRRVTGSYPAKLLTASTRRARPDVMSTKVKVGANYTSSRLTQRLTNLAGYDLPLFLNDSGLICESSGAGLLAYKDGDFFTPNSIETSLDSITMEFVISSLKTESRFVHTKMLSINDLYDAQALFLVGTSVEILEVSQLDHIKYDEDVTNSLASEILLKIQSTNTNSDFHHIV